MSLENGASRKRIRKIEVQDRDLWQAVVMI
jgi:hypothetical protein